MIRAAGPSPEVDVIQETKPPVVSGSEHGSAVQLELLDSRLRWLSAWTIHHANHLRDSRDGLKVGGHQASCASISTIMAVLYFHALGPHDKVAVKPHAGRCCTLSTIFWVVRA